MHALVICLFFFIILMVMLWGKRRVVIREPRPTPYLIGLLAIFKNESMVLDEFIQHYLWQGVDHFYLIDNGSTDTFMPLLQPYLDKKLVTLYQRPEKYQQVKHYNEVYNDRACHECQWLIVRDVDEYMYHRTLSLRHFFLGLDPAPMGGIYLAWNIFGSNGHDRQPSSIRLSFTKRKEAPIELTYAKAIVSTKNTVHSHKHLSGKRRFRLPKSWC